MATDKSWLAALSEELEVRIEVMQEFTESDAFSTSQEAATLYSEQHASAWVEAHANAEVDKRLRERERQLRREHLGSR